MVTNTTTTAIATETAAYKHWRWSQDLQGIVWLTFDREQASANTINREVLVELDLILDQLIKSIKPNGLVIKSGKTSGFIAGADISEFKDTDPSVVKEIIEHGHKVFSKLTISNRSAN